MTVVSITEPRFIREVIDRRRSVIVAYGRMESTAPQELCVLFQGRFIHRQEGHKGKIVPSDLIKAMRKIDIEQRKLNLSHRLPPLDEAEAKDFADRVMKSTIVQYFGNVPSKRNKALHVESDQLLHWNSKAFRFEEVFLPTFGKRLMWDFSVGYVYTGDIPPEIQHKKGKSLEEQTEAAVSEQVYQRLTFWLFGPTLEPK